MLPSPASSAHSAPARPASLAPYRAMLDQLQARGRLRALRRAGGVDFASNDYLGLAGSDALRAALGAALARQAPAGAGGSRLLRGHHPEHEALEAEAAAFFGAPRMLYFSTGYDANLAVLSTLPQRGDLVVHDEWIHASAHAGLRAGRADFVAARHNDPQAFEDAIGAWRARGGRGAPWIVVESLYSMDGDCAPLEELALVADRAGAFLFVDEAHATGVFGPGGRGLAAALEGRDNLLTLHTCGKALGCAGALVGAAPVLCDFLVNRARPFVFSTAPSPLQAAGVRGALKILAGEPQLQAALRRRVARANALFAETFGVEGSGTQILPLIVGEDSRAVELAAKLQARGFDIRAIRPPTVPEGTARLRISITLNAGEDDVERLFAAFRAIL